MALFGLPFALYQLATLRRDLDQVTRTGQFERGLRALMLRGLALMDRLQHDDTAYVRAEFRGWIDGVAGYIRRETNDELEEEFFRIEGQTLPPQQQLEAKIVCGARATGGSPSPARSGTRPGTSPRRP